MKMCRFSIAALESHTSVLKKCTQPRGCCFCSYLVSILGWSRLELFHLLLLNEYMDSQFAAFKNAHTHKNTPACTFWHFGHSHVRVWLGEVVLSLISVVFPVCVMRLESLSAEEGVTAGEKRGTAIRAFLKASSDTSRPPASMRAHTPTNMHAHAFFIQDIQPCSYRRGPLIATVTGPWRPLEEGHAGHRTACPTAPLCVFVFGCSPSVSL